MKKLSFYLIFLCPTLFGMDFDHGIYHVRFSHDIQSYTTSRVSPITSSAEHFTGADYSAPSSAIPIPAPALTVNQKVLAQKGVKALEKRKEKLLLKLNKRTLGKRALRRELAEIEKLLDSSEVAYLRVIMEAQEHEAESALHKLLIHHPNDAFRAGIAQTGRQIYRERFTPKIKAKPGQGTIIEDTVPPYVAEVRELLYGDELDMVLTTPHAQVNISPEVDARLEAALQQCTFDPRNPQEFFDAVNAEITVLKQAGALTPEKTQNLLRATLMQIFQKVTDPRKLVKQRFDSLCLLAHTALDIEMAHYFMMPGDHEKYVAAAKDLYCGKSVRELNSMSMAAHASFIADMVIDVVLCKVGSSVFTAEMNAIAETIKLMNTEKVHLFNFETSALAHMDELNRVIPSPVLKEIINNPLYVEADPRGYTGFNKYYARIVKNNQVYNAEVVYNPTTNTIQHFLYDRGRRGPLGKIRKKP